MNGTKHLVMGLWARKPFRHLDKFIASLRHTGFAGDVCLCVEEVTAETVEQMRAHGIIVERTSRTAQPPMTALASRYFNFLDFLVRHGGDYARVMLTEPATTVFQSDPFAVPLPADIVYTQERRRIVESPAEHDHAVVQAYGESVAQNMRDCMVSSANVTIGTYAGILRYLVAMTHELGGRIIPVTGAIDQGVHNFIVRMHPLRNAWLDPTDRFAAAMHTVPNEAVRIDERGVLIDGRLVPVLSHWDANAKVLQHVRTAPRFQLDTAMQGAWPAAVTPADAPAPSEDATRPANDAVVAFYQRQRDAEWLPLFLGSLRCVSDRVLLHCVGEFDQHELAMLARHDCVIHQVAATEPDIAENVAHFYLSKVLDLLTTSQPAPPDQVLVLDGMRGVFLRDPFLTRTIGLSVFCEGPTRIADSDYNHARLAFFVPPEQSKVTQPVISSSALRGPLAAVRDFYRQLFAELVGRADVLGLPKVVQGAFNKLCYIGDLGIPVIAHPNGAEVYFDFWPSGLAIDTRHGVRIGGTVPGVVIGAHTETPLMMKLRVDLSLSEARAA